MAAHIHMSVWLENDSFGQQSFALFCPSGCRASHSVHHAVAGQGFGTWGVVQRTAYHACMAWPSRQGGDVAIGGHFSTWYLADNVHHIAAEGPHLLSGHLVGIVFHLQRVVIVSRITVGKVTTFFSMGNQKKEKSDSHCQKC